MPNRILKESICTSEEVDKLTAFQEVVFYRLIVNCDDFGRADARPKLLASKLFPLKDIRPAQIEDALRALTSAELVITYVVGGKPFLQMKTWDRHQQVRNKVSKFPSPEDADTPCKQLISDDINCNQLIANVPVIQSNPIQSESNPNPNPKRARGDALSVFGEWAKQFAEDGPMWSSAPTEGFAHDLAAALADFAQMRKTIRKPLTQRAAELICQKLEKDFRREDWIPVLNQSVENSWQGLFPLKEDGDAAGNGRRYGGSGGVSKRLRDYNAQCQKHGADPSPAMLDAVKQMLEEDV